VDLEFEGNRKRGNYGRLLAYVFLDRQNFNVELVRKGLSPYYTKYGASKNYHAAFRPAERFARENKEGIWAGSGLSSRAPSQKQSGTRATGCRVKAVDHEIIEKKVMYIYPSNIASFKTVFSREEVVGPL
jgi:endonuclease YncB( thermonuclease family)